MLTIHPIEIIVSDPAIRGGKPVIAGRAVAVIDVAILYIVQNQTPEQIAEAYDLTPDQVHAALAYYFLHREELDAQQQAEEHEAEELLIQLGAKRVGSN